MQADWLAFKLGGIMMVPLSILAILALAVMFEKAVLYWQYTRLPQTMADLLESYEFDWEKLFSEMKNLNKNNYFYRFFNVITENRSHPAWWIESRAADEAQVIETTLSRRLWLLETTVTAAPLLGLMGTIAGMMHAFQLIGANGLVNPTGVTGGVAQALIATAVGLMIALVSLFGFNYFSRLQSQTLDEMERLGTRLIDRIRLDQQG
ncbi:MAG: MotA/TolQ/ExbB proton channel family protein [Betaproteobacteria bacterium]|nr:MotA/TolQ/ExbB proton channel family protein [Betaproteobacteria bacterium]